jgi:hypothetical protein
VTTADNRHTTVSRIVTILNYNFNGNKSASLSDSDVDPSFISRKLLYSVFNGLCYSYDSGNFRDPYRGSFFRKVAPIQSIRRRGSYSSWTCPVTSACALTASCSTIIICDMYVCNVCMYVCMYVRMYKRWAIKSSPCTATFNDLLCFPF